jgi:hypothetical protein
MPRFRTWSGCYHCKTALEPVIVLGKVPYYDCFCFIQFTIKAAFGSTSEKVIPAVWLFIIIRKNKDGFYMAFRQKSLPVFAQKRRLTSDGL